MPPTPGSSRISGSSEPPSVAIAPARGAADLETVRTLFAEYGESIRKVALLTGFAAELASLPAAYGPPRGELLVARDADAHPIGCIALKPLPDGTAEIKRLYVRPDGRRGGTGRALVLAIMERARELGYAEVKLDSLPSMAAAQALYRALGFVEIERYNNNPNPDLVFMSRRL
jgi:ribosomal protein S18 acetylase RimI-like enzyme